MSEMVERVARVICQSAGHDPEGRMIADQDIPNWRRYCGPALTVIAVMREPTAAMKDADRAVYGTEHFPLRPSEWSIDAIWRAMIDEALKD